MERLAQLHALLRWALRVRQPRPWGHVHTASPALGSPWCPGCDALLTEAIAHDDARKEKEMAQNWSIIEEVLTALDTQPRTLSTWEATFLESVKHQTFPLSPRQFAKLVELAEEYLDPLLAAELRGQQRLFV